MNRLPTSRGNDVVRALQRAGFMIARIKGSHHMMEHSDGRRTVVPVHGGKDIKRSLMRKIISDAGLTEQEFEALL